MAAAPAQKGSRNWRTAAIRIIHAPAITGGTPEHARSQHRAVYVDAKRIAGSYADGFGGEAYREADQQRPPIVRSRGDHQQRGEQQEDRSRPRHIRRSGAVNEVAAHAAHPVEREEYPERGLQPAELGGFIRVHADRSGRR